MFKHKFSMAHNPMALRYKLGSEGTAHRINHPVSMTKLFSVTSVFTRFSPNINNYTLMLRIPQRQLRYIEWKGVKIYDFQKIIFSTLFKLHIVGLGVLIPKRYHMLG